MPGICLSIRQVLLEHDHSQAGYGRVCLASLQAVTTGSAICTDVTPANYCALTHIWVCLQPTSGFDCNPDLLQTQARVITL